MKSQLVWNGLVTAGILLLATRAFGGDVWPTGREKVSLSAKPFALEDVRLLDGPFRAAMERDRTYLLSLEPDRLLHFFRVTAGLPARGEPMGGWEKAELRGHTMGHYLSACARMYAATGDKRLRERADGLVAELAKCQKALGSGYVSAFPESFIDRVIARKRVWAPWYTLHKILAGLLEVHVHCGNRQALEAAEGFAAWLEGRLAKVDEAGMHAMLEHTEQGGMNEALANLYGLTGEGRWLALSRRFVQRRYVEPLARREDKLKGEHVNSLIPNIIGTARQYELAGRDADREIVRYFWTQVTARRCYCTGGTSNAEHWRSDPNKLADQLGDHTQETCCTYNMLRLTRHLHAWQPDARYADYYERALINSILSTQDPDTGMMMYFVPLASGRWKTFNVPRDAFWCCTGTGMENHARYGEAIYSHDDSGVWVNLFIASQVAWKARGVTIRQETSFPEKPGTSLVVRTDKPAEFELRIRRPGWLAGAMKVRLNGRAVEPRGMRAGFAVFRRTWTDGDRLDVSLPMALRAWPMPDDPALLAAMYGPVLLAGELPGPPLAKSVLYVTENWFRFPRRMLGEAPTIVAPKPDPAVWLKPVAGRALTFRTTAGRPANVTLIPYYKLFGRRYVVYWRVLNEAGWRKQEDRRKAREAAEAKRREAYLARLVDDVVIGDRKSEADHKLASLRSASGTHLGRPWRHATDGGWFSYVLASRPGQPLVLRCTWWGGDRGARTFDILIDGQKIATVTLRNLKPHNFVDVEYPVPARLRADKDKVTVRFQARPGNTAGGLFGLALLGPEAKK